ncbi:hypothetical protein CK203_018662 [Vitis vinifera]|uniref:Uncharacterized protein n=1 Tax=Vitis vinifera TaxID=29760 RepID=A0A438JAS7_VITVI|nr:hypothetical protein CK203_018662 [Vitis vinifera]
MAESLDDGEFWLPAQFLTDKDILMDKGNINNSRNKGGLPQGLVSAPIALQDEFVKVDHGFVYENKRYVTWGMAGSPQSTLCAVGGGCGCKQASSRGSPISPSQVSSPPATWDLLYAAAGEVAKIRMNDEEYGYQQSRGLLAPPRKPSPISVPVKNANTDADSTPTIRFLTSISATQTATNDEAAAPGRLGRTTAEGNWPLPTPASDPEQRKNNEVGINRSNRPLGLSLSAWPPLQAQQQQQQPQQGGSGMRVVFLGTHGSRKECAGTGVFLPRRVGNPPEMRKKSGCSTALLPARVVQALNLKLDDVDAAVKLRSSYGFACEQRRAFRAQPVMNHEIRLPQEWTY